MLAFSKSRFSALVNVLDTVNLAEFEFKELNPRPAPSEGAEQNPKPSKSSLGVNGAAELVELSDGDLNWGAVEANFEAIGKWIEDPSIEGA